METIEQLPKPFGGEGIGRAAISTRRVMSNAYGRGPLRPSRRQVLGYSVATAGLVAAGCSTETGGETGAEDLSDRSTGAMENFAADTPFKAAEPFTLSMLWTDWPEVPVKDSWTFFTEIEKRTGVKL